MRLKKKDVKVTVTLGDVLHAPLLGSWDYICGKYGINEWCLSEGRAEAKDTIEISLYDAEHIGLIENGNEIED